jgi:hypothetical protein
MIVATVNTPVEVTVSGATPGLVDQITVEAYDPSDGTTIIAPTTSGITEPRPGTYRTVLTFTAAGALMVRWSEPDGVAEEPARVTTTTTTVPDADAPWRPGVDEVATLLIARTNRQLDQQVTTNGTFTDATVPSAAQVDKHIDLAVTDVAARVGVPIPPEQRQQARNLAALWAAALAELSVVPDGAADDERSVSPQYIAAYRAGLTDLIAACRSQYTRLA